MTESKSSRKSYDPGRQHMLQGSIEAGRQGSDCAFAAQSEEIPAIGAEITATGIQAFNPASVANDASTLGDRYHPSTPAVQKQQVFLWIDGKAARINNSIIINKMFRAARRPIQR